MREITIEQSTFERLQHHARPLLDTTDMVVNRALDALENLENLTSPGRNSPSAERSIDLQRLPNLTHTKVLHALVAGNRVDNPNWNFLIERVLVHAMKQVTDFDELGKHCPVNMVRGRKEDEGYRYLVEINASFQGMSANDACWALVVAAQSLGLELEVVFLWRTKEGAAYPGERARIFIPATSSDHGISAT